MAYEWNFAVHKQTDTILIGGDLYVSFLVKVKVNQSRYRPEWPRGFQEVKVPRFHDNGIGRW